MIQAAHRLIIRHLRLVVAILAEGNLLRAATGLNMTQSAVTKALQDAEAQMGVLLFKRTNRGVVLNAVIGYLDSFCSYQKRKQAAYFGRLIYERLSQPFYPT